MRVWAITLCFNRPDIIRASLAQYAATRNKELPYTHVLVDQKYPLGWAENSIGSAATETGNCCIIVSPERNLGLAKGFNRALEVLEQVHGPFQPDDYIIGYDGDSYPISPGWDMALITALHHDPRIVWASLLHRRAEIELAERGYTPKQVNQVLVWRAHRPCVNSVCAFKASWLKSIGGFSEPNAFYGGLECALWHKMDHSRHEWVYLPEYREAEPEAVPFQQDRLYQVWKWKHAHEGTAKMDFESWLRGTGQLPA